MVVGGVMVCGGVCCRWVAFGLPAGGGVAAFLVACLPGWWLPGADLCGGGWLAGWRNCGVCVLPISSDIGGGSEKWG